MLACVHAMHIVFCSHACANSAAETRKRGASQKYMTTTSYLLGHLLKKCDLEALDRHSNTAYDVCCVFEYLASSLSANRNKLDVQRQVVHSIAEMPHHTLMSAAVICSYQTAWLVVSPPPQSCMHCSMAL